MRLGTLLDYSKPPRELAESVVDLERAGADIVFVAEAYGFDAVGLLGFLAARTERVQLASGILPIYSRTPTLLAQTAAGLDALSGGRFVLGLGASGPQVIEGWHGVPYDHPVERTREIISICRQVWRREGPLVHDGLYTIPLPRGRGTGLGKPLKIINRPVRGDIPIWLAALGPKNVEMAASVAHGWLPFLFVPERAERAWGEALARGRAQRDPQLPPLDIAAGGLAAIGDGLEHLRDLARPMAALYIGGMGARGQNFYNSVVRRYGFEEAAERIQDLYLDGKTREAEAAIPAELLEGLTMIGSEGYIKERLAAFHESGVSVLNVTPIGPEPLGTLERLKEWMP